MTNKIVKLHACSACGKEGHNIRTCPANKTAKEMAEKMAKTLGKNQQEFRKNKLIAEREYSLSNNIVGLLSQEPFFAAISRYIDKEPAYDIRTACVYLDPKTLRFNMRYNPIFMHKLNNKQRIGVLKHEFYHVILGHVTDRCPPDVQENEEVAKTWNLATDLAINSWLMEDFFGENFDPKAHKEAPDDNFGGCFPGMGEFKNVPANKSSDWYYSLISQNKEWQKKLIQKFGGLSMDSHDLWGSPNGEEAEAWDTIKKLANAHLKNILERAVKECSRNNSWGSIPDSMRRLILAKLKNFVNWETVLRHFIKTSQKMDTVSTPKRINKRFPYIHPGTRIKRHAKIAVSIDQSGSVHDDMLNQFFGALVGLSYIASFTVIPFDCDVDYDNIFLWKKGKIPPLARTRSGGTNFDPPTQYVNDNKFDGHIVLTDMYAPKPGPSKCKRMWMTTPECYQNPYFDTQELVIPITPK